MLSPTQQIFKSCTALTHSLHQRRKKKKAQTSPDHTQNTDRDLTLQPPRCLAASPKQQIALPQSSSVAAV
jgi:hypothetical protein